MKYNIDLRGEKGEVLDGYVEMYDASGTALGQVAIHGQGYLIDSDIPEGVTHYRFFAPGYHWYGTSQLFDTNTITLIEETPILKYVLIGAAGVGAFLLLKRFLKF